MPLLGRAKQRIGSSARASEGKQNVLCAYLAAALLIGLFGNALVAAWWLDPLVGLSIRRRGCPGGPRGLAGGRVLPLEPA